MVKSSNTHHQHDHFEDEDDGEVGVKVEGMPDENKQSSHRSKHSETEQRRRSKINERFQILRELIPQNDQKRDKASFLLEVIEYIQFLQEKLNMYEGSYQGWSSEPEKLTPWRNCTRPAESLTDHAQLAKKSPDQESQDNVVVPPEMFTIAQNSVESDLVFKSAERHFASATQLDSLNRQIQAVQPNVFDPIGLGCLPSQPLDELVSESEKFSRPQSQFGVSRICTGVNSIPSHEVNEQEQTLESRSESVSKAYSHGILNTLTQALQSSGVDLSRASISVNIDVGKRAIDGVAPITSCSKDHRKQSSNNEAMAESGVGRFSEDSEQFRKRLRREEI